MVHSYPIRSIRFKRREFQLILVKGLAEMPRFAKAGLFYRFVNSLGDKRIILVDEKEPGEFYFLPLPSEPRFRKQYRIDLDKFFDRFDPSGYSFKNAGTIELSEEAFT